VNELPRDAPRLRAILAHLDQQIADTATVATYLRLQRDAVHRALTAADPPRLEPQQAPPKADRRPTAEYLLEPKAHPKHPMPVIVHKRDCTMSQRAPKGITAHEARTALEDEVISAEACQFCRPDTALGLLDT
jgi:hypothetical protein